MKQYDIFVLTSEFESFGNVIVEAMGIGIPVVAMDCPVGPREILQNGNLGKLISNNNMKDFTDAIIDIKINYPINTIIKAYEAAKMYDVKNVINHYIKMLENI